MARKGTDYSPSNISESDLVCKPSALLINVQSVFYAGLYKSFPCVGVEATFMEVYLIKVS